jgi:hypothetical protein
VEAWLRGDPLPWLLEKETPAVRHLALRRLLDEPPDSAAVRRARAAAMRSDPIAAILAAQDADGFFITGEGVLKWPLGRTRGPGFACDYNGGLSCAWGAINGGPRHWAGTAEAVREALLAFALIAPAERSPLVQRAVDQGVEFLLSRDAAVADYPAGRQGKTSPLWFRLGSRSAMLPTCSRTLKRSSPSDQHAMHG